MASWCRSIPLLTIPLLLLLLLPLSPAQGHDQRGYYRFPPAFSLAPQTLNDPPPSPACQPPAPTFDLTKPFFGVLPYLSVAIAQLAGNAGSHTQKFLNFHASPMAAWHAMHSYANVSMKIGAIYQPGPQFSVCEDLSDLPKNVVNMNIAFMYAIYYASERVLMNPVGVQTLRAVLIKETGIQADPTKFGCKQSPADKVKCDAEDAPACVGYQSAEILWQWLLESGWNVDGSKANLGKRTFPLQDYTGYRPLNSPYALLFPEKWQPLIEFDKGYYFTQEFDTPQAKFVKPAWLSMETYNSRKAKPPPMDRKSYRKSVDEMLEISVNLNDTTKMLAEYFNAPPVFMLEGMAQLSGLAAGKPTWTPKKVMAYLLIMSVAHDGHTLTLRDKVKFNSARPMTMIRAVYGNKAVKVKKADGTTVEVKASDWQSYLRTAPEPEHPSGGTCVCVMFAEWSSLFRNGPPADNAEVSKDSILGMGARFQAGCSRREVGVPQTTTDYLFPTVGSFYETCSIGRRWGGVHNEAATKEAVRICRGLAKEAYQLLVDRTGPILG